MHTTKILRVFIASPSDVDDEAEAVTGVLEEINRLAGDTLGYRLEALRWKRDASPGVGADPQEVISRQLDSEFDILVAIFWTRAGTPTPRAPSGSIEEVLRAIEKNKASAGAVQVLVYFKSGQVDPYSVDIEQFNKVRKFRNDLSAQGVFYKSFDDATSLESLLRVDLVKVAKELLSREGDSGKNGAETAAASQAQTTTSEDDNDLGLLDYLDINETSLAKAGEMMAGITSALHTMTESDARRGDEIKKLGGTQRAEARRILQRAAEDWDATASNIETMLASLKNNTGEAFKALSRSIPLMATGTEEAKKKRSNLQTTLRGLTLTMEKAATSTQGFRDTIASYPRLIAEHNKAKRRLVGVLDGVTAHFRSVVDMANDIAASLDEI